MKRLIVGIFVLLVVMMALHYGVITVDRVLLHKNAWHIIQWVAGILGGAIISSMLNESQRSNP